jgi:hypothetical protein
LRHKTTGVPPETSTIGATGDRASNARPAVRQLVQWQITVIIDGSMAARHTAPHAHTIVPIAPAAGKYLQWNLTGFAGGFQANRAQSQSRAKPTGA